MDAWPRGRRGAAAQGSRPGSPTNDAVRDVRPRGAAEARATALARPRGPLRQSDWQSRGWTHQRNLTQLLDYLSAQGRVAVAGRAGQRPPVGPRGARPADGFPADHRARKRDRMRARRRLRSLGIVRVGSPATSARIGLEAEIEGVRGRWRVEPELLDRPFAGRTALLSPFDRTGLRPGVSPRRCSGSSTGSRSTCRRRSGAGATTCCRCSTAIGSSAGSTPEPIGRRGVLRVPALHLEAGATARGPRCDPGRARRARRVAAARSGRRGAGRTRRLSSGWARCGSCVVTGL